MTRFDHQEGFTQIELLIVIGIVTVLAAMAFMSLSRYQNDTAVRETARLLDGDLILCRNEARSRPQTITLSFTVSGYTVFIDNNGDSVFNAGDTLLWQRAFTNQVLILPPVPFAFTTTGEVTMMQQITASRGSEPNKQYRVTIFTTGLTRVDRSETAGATWTKAW